MDKLGSFLDLKAMDTFAEARDQELARMGSAAAHVPGARHKLNSADWLNAVDHATNPEYKFHQMFPEHPDHMPMRADEEEPNPSDPNEDGRWDREDPIAAEEDEAALARGTAARLRR